MRMTFEEKHLLIYLYITLIALENDLKRIRFEVNPHTIKRKHYCLFEEKRWENEDFKTPPYVIFVNTHH